MYVYIYTYIYTYIGIICTYICIYIYIHIYVYPYIYVIDIDLYIYRYRCRYKAKKSYKAWGNSRFGGTKVSTIDVTSKTICEHLYLVPVLGKFGPWVNCPCGPTPPQLIRQLFLNFCVILQIQKFWSHTGRGTNHVHTKDSGTNHVCVNLCLILYKLTGWLALLPQWYRTGPGHDLAGIAQVLQVFFVSVKRRWGRGIFPRKNAWLKKIFARDLEHWADGNTTALSHPDQRTPSVQHKKGRPSSMVFHESRPGNPFLASISLPTKVSPRTVDRQNDLYYRA